MYTVLLVDDEPAVCLGLQKLIHWEECGFEVGGICSNGQEAYEEYCARHYDLVITDIRMPVMDGLALLRKIHTSGRPCQCIVLSAYGEFKYAQEAMQYGVDYYLLKPLEETVLEGFLNRIRENLDANEQPGVHTVDPDQIEKQYRMSRNGVIPEMKGYINRHYSEKLTLEMLAAKYSFSPIYLGRLFRQTTGFSFNDYIRKVRISAACQQLKEGKYSINEICERVGFSDLSYFYKVFKQETGETPGQYSGEEYSS